MSLSGGLHELVGPFMSLSGGPSCVLVGVLHELVGPS